MSSLLSVHCQGKERWNAIVSLCGAAMWALFACLAGLRRGPFGIIELLFLFAPLVIVPLGSELTRRLTYAGSRRAVALTRILQVLCPLAVSAAFWLPPGRTAAGLSGAWLLLCLFLAAERLLQSPTEARTGLSLILNLAYLDLILGAAWLVASRAGFRPMGFQEPIILLTAVHFHYSGFATALIASATLHEFQRRNLVMPGVRVLIWLVVLLPYLLAAGFVFSPLLRFVAAIALATCVTALAMILLWFAGEFHSGPGRVYLRAACCAAMAAFSLAGIYTVSEYFDRDWITVPGMANSHGALNGLGFVLFALLAWLMELQEAEAQDVRESDPVKMIRSTRSTVAFARSTGTAGLHPSQRPEFVARDFYDR